MYSRPEDRAWYASSQEFTQKQMQFVREHRRSGCADVGALLAEESPVSSGFHLPIDPKVIVVSYCEAKCRFKDSAKRPLFETFQLPENPNRETISMLLKLDDDLTQDQLTLQLFTGHGFNVAKRWTRSQTVVV
jgi:hypothetical protein